MMDLTPMDIKAFYNSVSHLSKSVCSKIKMCLNGILETAVENGLCEHNPAHKVKIESTATPRVKEVFSNAEIEIASAWFLQTMPEVVLALETGVRRGELLGFSSRISTPDGMFTASPAPCENHADKPRRQPRRSL